jgi:hypothetical protein
MRMDLNVGSQPTNEVSESAFQVFEKNDFYIDATVTLLMTLYNGIIYAINQVRCGIHIPKRQQSIARSRYKQLLV